MIKNYRQLVPRYLTANKKTSLSMVISILFSVAMLVSVGIFIGKYHATRIEIAQEGNGKYHAGFLSVQEDTLGKLKRFKGISKVGTTIIVGEIPLVGDRIQIKGADAVALDLLNAKAIKGRLPEKENEIAIEEWMYNRLEKKPQIGEKFKLKYSLQNCVGETVEIKENEFVFCGILEDLEDSKAFQTGKAYVTLKTANGQLGNILKVYEQWFALKDNVPVELTLDDVQAYAFEEPKNGEHKIEGYRPNMLYLTALKEAKNTRNITIVFNIIVAVAVGLVIYNVFNISVLQRKKHYGLLRAIGITQRQIKVMLFLEALLFEVIVVPIGIIVGILSTSLLSGVIGGTALKGSIIKQITPFDILLPVFVSFISVAAAVYSPAKLASKVSAIESMSMEGKKTTKKLYKASKFRIINKIVGYSGKMALNNLKRYKKRFVATVTAIAVGIALFIFSTYIIYLFNPTAQLEGREIRADYVLKVPDNRNVGYGYSEGNITKIQSVPGVKSVDKYKLIIMDYILDSHFITPSGVEESKKGSGSFRLIMDKYHVSSQVYGCSDEFIKSLRKSVSDKENEGQIFIVQNLNNKTYTRIKSGDEINTFTQYLSGGKYVDFNKTIKLDYVLNKLPLKLNEAGNGYIVTFVPYKFIEDNYKLFGYQKIEINIDRNADRSRIEEELQSIARTVRDGELVSYQKEVEKWHDLQFKSGAILMSLVAIIAIVGFINIMNTFNMNIIIRKKEFGMLRALGFTKKELRKTLLIESMVYGISSSVIGIGTGCLLIWVMCFLKRDQWALKFYVDLKIVVFTIFVTVILSICASILPMKKIISEDIVESIQAVE